MHAAIADPLLLASRGWQPNAMEGQVICGLPVSVSIGHCPDFVRWYFVECAIPGPSADDPVAVSAGAQPCRFSTIECHRRTSQLHLGH
jgi:hypothetical protein